MNADNCKNGRIFQQEVELIVPTINCRPLLSLCLWEKELANGRECKMATKNAVDSNFNVHQSTSFIIFINSKVARE